MSKRIIGGTYWVQAPARCFARALPLLAFCLGIVGWSHSVVEAQNTFCTPSTPTASPDGHCLVSSCLDELGRWNGPIIEFDPDCETDNRRGKAQCTAVEGAPIYPPFEPEIGTPPFDPTPTWIPTYWCTPVEPKVYSGGATPKYMILSVVYSPPGSSDCMWSGEMLYGKGSKLGTTVSVGSSFAEGTKVSVSAKGGVGANTGEAGVGFEYSHSDSQKDAFSMTKQENSTHKVLAPCKDGIHHDFDEIWITLRPQLTIDLAQPEGCDACEQVDAATVTIIPGTGNTLKLYAGYLKGTLPMPENIASTLSNHGLTDEDLATILMADPLANLPGDSTEVPDLERFATEGRATFPYGRPPPPGRPSLEGFSVTNEHMTMSDHDVEYAYKVALSAEISSGLSPTISAKLKFEQTWAWTNKSSESATNTQSSTASLTMSVPSADYNGPPSIRVYYDRIYSTYAFIGER